MKTNLKAVAKLSGKTLKLAPTTKHRNYKIRNHLKPNKINKPLVSKRVEAA